MSPIAVRLPVRRSLAGWAALALGMVLFFYVLTLALAAACVYLPYLLVSRFGFNPFSFTSIIAVQAIGALIVGSLLAVGLILSLVPAPARFQPPGPRLTAAGQPRLFAEIERIAGALGEDVPEEVYLAMLPNAGVLTRGGWMGFGGRRVMVLGLPLLDVFTVSEFRAVLAHELAHYYGGDTRLGPWVYAARAGIFRTHLVFRKRPETGNAMSRLSLAGIAYLLVQAALGGYGRLFLRATGAVSRRQEYRADELACALAGSRALMSCLRKLEGLSAVYRLFWVFTVQPVLQAGYCLPLAESFARYVAIPKVAGVIALRIAQKLMAAKAGAFASHPPLRDRLAAATSFRGPEQPESSAPARSLFDGVDGLEAQLLARASSANANLRLVAGDRVGQDVFLPQWRALRAGHARLLEKIPVEDLPRLAQDPREVIAQMPDPEGVLLSRPQRMERARSLLWKALIVALVERGGDLQGYPGENWLRLGEDRLQVEEIAREIEGGKLDGAAWAQRVAAMRIGQMKLAPAVSD